MDLITGWLIRIVFVKRQELPKLYNVDYLLLIYSMI
jgi:hypothetical protein